MNEATTQQMTSSEELILRFRAICLRIDHAVAELIDPETEDQNLRDARCLLTSALMRGLGISRVLIQTSAITTERTLTVYDLADVRTRIHAAFGAPGDWSGDIEQSLRDLYALILPRRA